MTQNRQPEDQPPSFDKKNRTTFVARAMKFLRTKPQHVGALAALIAAITGAFTDLATLAIKLL